MTARGRMAILLGLLLGGTAPLAALNDPLAEELSENRARLAHYKASRLNYDRLLQELRGFLSLPPADQERLRRVDQELHQEPPSDRTRLFDVMERYADWLDRLAPAERDQIQATGDWKQRLTLIRQIRERQWLEHLPQADRDQLARAGSPEDARKLLALLHERDRERQESWDYAFKHWDDVIKKRAGIRPDALPEKVKTYVKEYLEPRLSPEEKIRLMLAAEKPQKFAQVLVELADKHPSALKGSRGPTHWEELPAEVRRLLDRLLKRPLVMGQLKKAEGKWPQYGGAVAFFAHRHNIALPYELWPAEEKDLSRPVQEFVQQHLLRVLGPPEKDRLQQARGQWPAFPETIEELANKHHLQVPWFSLPPSRDQWDLYRPAARKTGESPPSKGKGLPDVPRPTLRAFYTVELTPEERAALHFSPDDPAGWERLKQVYFQKKPRELKRLREEERGKRPNKKKKNK